MQEFQEAAKLLIRLSVQYGFPTYAVLPYILKDDKGDWQRLLAGFNCEIFLSAKEGQICFLISDCVDKAELEKALTNLPLVKEGFFEIRIYQFFGCKNLDGFFGQGG
ncbi:hypothetical protein KXD93_22020 [Mucilaginibacter sp. BJC16-A38]|uniref:hypothetical protein n=1 Tax=Mucilaginibacter phenanthrenivorans TaxID=1234842 RepID=UPI0021572532|nr:hypothetical protein [Mucilaginibacter phenanthrenivorans]MCR8560346.1 hypothetical protein [Mucilaginibacter phenanthrenivorans]